MDFGSDPPKRKFRKRSTRAETSLFGFGTRPAARPPALETAKGKPHGESCAADPSSVAYVTRATFKHLAGRNIEAAEDQSLEMVFSAIFHRSLADLLNAPEARRLYALKLMTEQQFSKVRVTTVHYSREYVFKVASSRFHRSETCELLRSDFVNYRVPPQIKALGEEKVREFQEFCDANKALLRENDPEKFWRHVGAHFRVQISNERVHYANSGIQELRELSIEQLRNTIEGLLDEALAILENRNSGAQVKKVRFAIDRKKACATLKDPGTIAMVNRLFDLKYEMLDALLELYFKQAGAKGFLLPEVILRQAGLEPCKGCQLSPPVIVFD